MALTNLANDKVLVFLAQYLEVDQLTSIGKVVIWIAIALSTFIGFAKILKR